VKPYLTERLIMSKIRQAGLPAVAAMAATIAAGMAASATPAEADQIFYQFDFTKGTRLPVFTIPNVFGGPFSRDGTEPITLDPVTGASSPGWDGTGKDWMFSLTNNDAFNNLDFTGISVKGLVSPNVPSGPFLEDLIANGSLLSGAALSATPTDQSASGFKIVIPPGGNLEVVFPEFGATNPNATSGIREIELTGRLDPVQQPPPTNTPEPGSLPLLLTGAGLVTAAGALRGRNRALLTIFFGGNAFPWA
jgi:hypothetical protein